MAPATASAPVKSLPRVDLFGVEIMSVGTWYPHTFGPDGEPLAGQPWEVTAEMLDDIAVNAASLGEIVRPGLNIGHDAPIPRDASGNPLYGAVRNVRRDGDRLLADFVGVLEQHASGLASGFDGRSVEVAHNVTIDGKTYGSVLEGVAIAIAEPAISGMSTLFPRVAASRRAVYASTPTGAPDMDEKTFTERVAAAVGKLFGANAAPVTEISATVRAEIAEKDRTIAAQKATIEAAAAKAKADADAAAEAAAVAAVEAEIKAGRVIPAKRESALKLARADSVAFAEICAAFKPAQPVPGAAPVSGAGATAGDAPSEGEIEMEIKLGLARDREQALKTIASRKASTPSDNTSK